MSRPMETCCAPTCTRCATPSTSRSPKNCCTRITARATALQRPGMTQLSLRARFLAGILFCVGLTLVLLAFWAALVQERVEQGLLDDVMQTNLGIYEKYTSGRYSGQSPT